MYARGMAGILRYAPDDSEEDNARGEGAGTKHAGTEIQSRGHQRNGEDEQHGDGGECGGGER